MCKLYLSCCLCVHLYTHVTVCCLRMCSFVHTCHCVLLTYVFICTHMSLCAAYVCVHLYTCVHAYYTFKTCVLTCPCSCLQVSQPMHNLRQSNSTSPTTGPHFNSGPGGSVTSISGTSGISGISTGGSDISPERTAQSK